MQKKLENFNRLLEIMDKLRVECPWDREQTMLSLRNNTIEECFELTEALLKEDMTSIREELGDLLLHIVFYAKMAEEQSAFCFDDIAKTLNDKLIYRHPHVFGNTQADDTRQVMQNWEALKAKKKTEGGVLSGVPRGMPALPKALRIGQKAASAGFDWQKREEVWAKVKEEIAEVEQEIRNYELATKSADKGGEGEIHNSKLSALNLEEEFGDLFFSLTNAARLYNIDPEAALERTNQKFTRRFTHIERRAKENQRSLQEMSLPDMEKFWDEAKKIEKTKKITFQRITSPNDNHYVQAQELYHEAFPACERRLEPKHIETLADETFFAYTIYIGETFAGILYFWRWDNFSYIEHLATLPALRGLNIGGAALELWKEQEAGRTLLLEIEPPEDEITRRREAFYTRHGFVSNPYHYLHPSYGVATKPHKLVVMSFPRPIEPIEFENFKRHSLNHIIKR